MKKRSRQQASKPGARAAKAVRFEYSAGGIVCDHGNLLMVKVENLEGNRLWTFPKGHIEKGEKAPEAALREVEEETGYRCKIDRPFERVQYFFRRGGHLTKKTVTWFLMQPLNKTGAPDADEILAAEWVATPEAQKRAVYPSDIALLRKLSA